MDLARRTLQISCLSFALAACGNAIVDVDFEADTPGLRPSSDPSGPPNDDVVRIDTSDNNNLLVEANGIDGKSLVYQFGSVLAEADFIGQLDAPPEPTYWFVWEGRAENFSSATTPIRFYMGNFDIGVGVIEIRDGQFSRGIPDQEEALGPIDIGTDHTVIVRLDTGPKTFQGAIFQPGGGRLPFGPKQLLFSGREPSDDTLRLSISYDIALGTGPGRYLVDNIRITAQEPDTP